MITVLTVGFTAIALLLVFAIELAISALINHFVKKKNEYFPLSGVFAIINGGGIIGTVLFFIQYYFSDNESLPVEMTVLYIIYCVVVIGIMAGAEIFAILNYKDNTKKHK